MNHDHRQRRRANALRAQLKETIRQTQLSIQTSNDLITECLRRRSLDEDFAASARHLQATRRILKNLNPG